MPSDPYKQNWDREFEKPNYKALYGIVHRSTTFTRPQAKLAVIATLRAIQELLMEGHNVSIFEFGRWVWIKRAMRKPYTVPGKNGTRRHVRNFKPYRLAFKVTPAWRERAKDVKPINPLDAPTNRRVKAPVWTGRKPSSDS